MQTYELALLVDPDLKAEDQKSLLVKIKKAIDTAGGKLMKEEDKGRVELVYPIKKKSAAGFSVLTFSMPETAMGGVEKNIKVEGRINRYLLTKKEGKERHGVKVAK